jgi:1-acyl-sn-glycerol-3-phosphate acyltransferase
MFPEGKRSRSAQLQPALSGSALIAVHSGAPILPVGITGTEKMKGLAWILHRPQITVNIGQPFSMPSVNGKLTKDELARLTRYIMERIAELLPRKYGGNYAKKGATEHEN